MKARREDWKAEQPKLDPKKLVFLDETWLSMNATRTHGRCRRGQRLVTDAPHGRWETTTFLVA